MTVEAHILTLHLRPSGECPAAKECDHLPSGRILSVGLGALCRLLTDWMRSSYFMGLIYFTQSLLNKIGTSSKLQALQTHQECLQPSPGYLRSHLPLQEPFGIPLGPTSVETRGKGREMDKMEKDKVTLKSFVLFKNDSSSHVWSFSGRVLFIPWKPRHSVLTALNQQCIHSEGRDQEE